MDLTLWTLVGFALVSTTEALFAVNAGNTTGFSFAVDHEQNQFLLDGRPFRYVSGSFHYFRTPREYWRDRLRKLRAAGLNAVSTYVEWSLHQPYPAVWKWNGDADLEHFLSLAQEEDLLVLLRAGPYICAERDLGGLPVWLLSLEPGIRLRTSDSRYMRHVTTYINELMRRVKPFLRGNGGPVIMVQVENEYGSYEACDFKYTSQLRDLFSSHVGSDALLYTTDGDGSNMLRCGKIPGVYTTVDFGTGSNVTNSFATMRLFQPTGPLVDSEFYSGWLTHWDESYQRVNKTSVAKKLDEILSLGASVNIYMFYGGTNFGFTSGANTDPRYRPQLTTYDYDAPVTEAGDLTDKYYLIKNVISKYLPIPNITLPAPSPKGDYGEVRMDVRLSLFDPLVREKISGTKKYMQHAPPTFESLDISLAFVLYETDLPAIRPDPSILGIGSIHDRALIYEDGRFLGTLSRARREKTIPLSDPYGQRLQIIVENQGHVNAGNEIHDFKGLGNVTLNGLPLRNWNATALEITYIVDNFHNLTTVTTGGVLNYGPLILMGVFEISGDPLDTYLDTTGWGKGVAFVNGKNLGRYWPAVGPQITLYVPATFLNSGRNILILYEFEYVPRNGKIQFQTEPNLNSLRRHQRNIL